MFIFDNEIYNYVEYLYFQIYHKNITMLQGII